MRRKHYSQILLILGLSLCILFTGTRFVHADVGTSHYDITLTQPSVTSGSEVSPLLPKTSQTWSRGFSPQTKGSQQRMIFYVGILLIIVLLVAIGHELKRRYQQK